MPHPNCGSRVAFPPAEPHFFKVEFLQIRSHQAHGKKPVFPE